LQTPNQIEDEHIHNIRGMETINELFVAVCSGASNVFYPPKRQNDVNCSAWPLAVTRCQTAANQYNRPEIAAALFG